MIESWNGTKWSVVHSPNRGAVSSYNLLDGVSCVSAKACTAAGAYGSGMVGVFKTLIESN